MRQGLKKIEQIIKGIHISDNLDDIDDFLREKEYHLYTHNFSHDLYRNISDNSGNGWKLSIQGNTVEDSILLNRLLFSYFKENDICYKIATRTRFDMIHRAVEGSERFLMFSEQSKKAMTVYCPDKFDVNKLAEDVANLITEYKGFEGVPNPKNYKHYSGGIYIRNDRDLDGNYIENH